MNLLYAAPGPGSAAVWCGKEGPVRLRKAHTGSQEVQISWYSGPASSCQLVVAFGAPYQNGTNRLFTLTEEPVHAKRSYRPLLSYSYPSPLVTGSLTLGHPNGRTLRVGRTPPLAKGLRLSALVG